MRTSGFTVVPTFLVLGPPLGAIVFWLLTLGADLLASGAFDSQAWRGAQVLLSIYVINSYFLGLLPAAAASACYLMGVRRNWSFLIIVGATSLTGLIVASLVPISTGELDEAGLSMTAAGAASALLVSLCFECFRSLKAH
jgi:hypothetical protein